jgi:hypothetical protein
MKRIRGAVKRAVKKARAAAKKAKPDKKTIRTGPKKK